MMKVALIGTGAFATEHVRAIRSLGNRLQLLAAVSPDEEKGRAFCEQYAIAQFFSETDAMLEVVQPELVFICTPPHTHAELSLKCLQAGAHVLCEKPLCASLAEFDLLQAAASAARKHLSCVFQWRFGSGARHLKSLIETGALGEFHFASCQTLWYRDEAYYSTAWRSDKTTALGGTTTGHGIHLMDLMLWLLPEWETVQGIIKTRGQNIQSDNLSIAQIRFGNGGLGNVSNSAISPRQESHLRLDFEKGTVEVKGLYSAKNANWKFTSAPNISVDLWLPNEDIEGLLDAQVLALVNSLERGEAPLVTGDEARRILEFLTAFYKSSSTGQAVQRGTLRPDEPHYQRMV